MVDDEAERRLSFDHDARVSAEQDEADRNAERLLDAPVARRRTRPGVDFDNAA